MGFILSGLSSSKTNYVDLPEAERQVVSVITVAAPCGPKLTEDELGSKNESELEDLKGENEGGLSYGWT